MYLILLIDTMLLINKSGKQLKFTNKNFLLNLFSKQYVVRVADKDDGYSCDTVKKLIDYRETRPALVKMSTMTASSSKMWQLF